MTNDEIEALEKRLHLRAEIERLTREMAQLQRFKWNDEQMRILQERAETAERERDEALAALQRRADELNVLQGSIAAYQAGTLERKVAELREALKEARRDLMEFYGSDTAVERIDAALAATEKKDG